MTDSFAVWVEYEVTPGHGHMVVCADAILREDMKLVLTGIEEYATELADQVLRCSEDRHNGHGRTHSQHDAQLAYEAAVFQLLTTDYQAEWEEIQRKMRVYTKWGGQVPEMVFLPDNDDPTQWTMMLVDSEGNPTMQRLNQGIMDDVMPHPKDLGARPNKDGPGWTLPKYGG